MQRGNFVGYIGSSASHLLRGYRIGSSDRSVAKYGTAIYLERRSAAYLRLLEGAAWSGDGDNVDSLMPTGVSAGDFLSVEVYADTAYVDLSQNFQGCVRRAVGQE